MSATPSRIRSAASADLAAVVDLLNACDAAEMGGPDTTAQDIASDWALDGFDLGRDAWVALADNGRLVGYAYTGDQLRNGELEADFWVHPERDEPGLAGRLLSFIERRASELTRVRGYGHEAALGIFCITVNGAKRELLRQHGFQLARTVFRMAADLETTAAVALSPEGVDIRAFRLEEDGRVMHATMQEAFADHFWPSNEPFEAWRTRLAGHSDFDPDLWFIAWDGEQAAGGLVAYDHGDLGWIKGLGVRRPWRCRGIGSALLAHAVAELARRGQRRVELGVDAEGATRPLRVYERAGMRVTFAYESFTLRLAAPGPSSP